MKITDKVLQEQARKAAFKDVAKWLKTVPVRSRYWRLVMPDNIEALERGELAREE